MYAPKGLFSGVGVAQTPQIRDVSDYPPSSLHELYPGQPHPHPLNPQGIRVPSSVTEMGEIMSKNAVKLPQPVDSGPDDWMVPGLHTISRKINEHTSSPHFEDRTFLIVGVVVVILIVFAIRAKS